MHLEIHGAHLPVGRQTGRRQRRHGRRLVGEQELLHRRLRLGANQLGVVRGRKEHPQCIEQFRARLPNGRVAVPVLELHVEAADLRIHPDFVPWIGGNELRADTLDFQLQVALLGGALVGVDLFLGPAPALGEAVAAAQVCPQRQQAPAEVVDAPERSRRTPVERRTECRNVSRDDFVRRRLGQHGAAREAGRHNDQQQAQPDAVHDRAGSRIGNDCPGKLSCPSSAGKRIRPRTGGQP